MERTHYVVTNIEEMIDNILNKGDYKVSILRDKAKTLSILIK